jgi:hypothetical protein
VLPRGKNVAEVSVALKIVLQPRAAGASRGPNRFLVAVIVVLVLVIACILLWPARRAAMGHDSSNAESRRRSRSREANNACFVIKDANGFAVSYVYFESEREWVSNWQS